MYLRRLPSGSWQATVKIAGRRTSVTAATEREVRRRAAEAYLRLGGMPDELCSVAELVDVHVGRSRERWAPSTLEKYETVRDRLPAWFVDMTVGDVSARHIDRLFEELLAAGRSPHEVHRVRALLSGAWRRGIRLGYAAANPVRDIPAPPRPVVEIVAPPVDVVTRLLAAAEHPQDRLLVRLAATLGARRGELVALQWGDVDLEAGEVMIRRSLLEVRGGVVERATKTGRKGHRRLSIGEQTLAELREHRAEQCRRAFANGLGDPVWVFSLTAGATPWLPRYAHSRFDRLRRQTGVPRLRLHDLRHYVATQMLAAGVPVVQVASRLGHSQPTTTVNHYAHALPQLDRNAAFYLDELLEAD